MFWVRCIYWDYKELKLRRQSSIPPVERPSVHNDGNLLDLRFHFRILRLRTPLLAIHLPAIIGDLVENIRWRDGRSDILELHRYR